MHRLPWYFLNCLLSFSFLLRTLQLCQDVISVLKRLHLCLIILSAHWIWPIHSFLTWAVKSSQGPYLTPFHFTHFSLPRKGPFCWVFFLSNILAQLVPHRLQATLSSIGLCLSHSGVYFNIMSYFLQSVWKTWVMPQSRHFLWCSWGFTGTWGINVLRGAIRNWEGTYLLKSCCLASGKENNHNLIKWHGTMSPWNSQRKKLKKKKAWWNILCGERYAHWDIPGFPLGAAEEFMWKG